MMRVRITIGRKIALLSIMLYPWFALGGIVGITAVERSGQEAQALVDRVQFAHLVDQARVALLELSETSGRSVDIGSAAAGLGRARQSIQDAEGMLQNARVPWLDHQRVRSLLNDIDGRIVEVLRLMAARDLAAGAPAEQMNAALQALQAKLRDLGALLPEGGQALSSPYKARAAAIVTIALLTVLIVIFGIVASLIMSRSIARPLRKLTDASAQVAAMKGDLTKELAVTTADEVGDLAQSFNLMLGTLRDLLRQVGSVAERVTQASQEVAGLSEHGAKDMTRQLDAVKQSVRTVESFVERANHIATHAEAVVSIAREALETTRAGRERMAVATDEIHRVNQDVDSMANRMTLLGERSRAASDLVRLVEELSHQTDVLAVNAAIEATKAGESGEGFRVVAQGVRQLAERSAEAAERVRDLLLEIQNELHETGTVCQNTGKTVERSVKAIESSADTMQLMEAMAHRTTKAAEEISEATRDQQKSSDAMAKSMASIHEVAQQGAQRSEHIREQTGHLEALAERLRAALGEFRL